MRAKHGIAAIAACLLSATAQAQDGGGQGNIPAVADWNYDSIYRQGGLRADTLLNATIIGQNGNEIGDVQNAIFDRRNRMQGIIAEVGGVWDIGDTHIAVPFQQLTFMDNGVQVPVTEGNAGQFDLFGEDSFLDPQALQGGQGGAPEQDAQGGGQAQDGQAQGNQPRGGQWRVTSLMDDYATFPDGAGYGYVDDVLIDPEGRIQAVVVQTAAEAFRAGHFAFPFVGYAGDWRPGAPAFVIPYAREDIQRIPTFRYQQYEDLLD